MRNVLVCAEFSNLAEKLSLHTHKYICDVKKNEQTTILICYMCYHFCILMYQSYKNLCRCVFFF